MYNTILVGIDDSDYSRAAVIEASNWTKRHGGRTILVNAVYFDEEEFSLAPEQRERRFELGRKVCLQRKDMVSSEFGIEAESISCEGEPPEVITDVAREKEADLIALGTYGRKGLKRLLMGSVTAGVIGDSPCDVLIVKKPCTECTGSYRSILVPYDGSESSKKALGKACAIAKIDSSEVTVLYVIPRYEEMIGFLKTESVKKSLESEAQKIMGGALKLGEEMNVSVSTVVREGNAADRINETSALLKNDLIIMGSHGWHGVSRALMGSTAERVIIGASCPVLVTK